MTTERMAQSPAATTADPASGSMTSIVVLGGGFAGTSVVRALASRLPQGVGLTLISDESYTTFNPLLAEAVGASIFPEQVVAPLREIVRPGDGRTFIMGRVTQVDRAARAVHCETLAGSRTVHYDHLVLAVGNRANLALIPGMAEHAFPMKTVGDAMEIRNVVLRRVACIELETDAARRRALGHFVVIGGGFSGVEVAGELADCLAGIRRYYPRVRPDELQVTLLHDQDRLLPELPPGLGEAAAKSMRARGVQIRLSSRAREVCADHVVLESGESIASATVICTIGTQANPLIAGLGLPTQRGKLVVAPDLAVTGAPGVWALGDCALVPNGAAGEFAPPTAQFAVREGAHLARNLLRALRGASTQPFKHKSRGSMASIGHMRGVAEVFGVPLHGLPAWFLWRAYYLSQMPTLRRKLRIYVEWTWGMLFPTDITHLRFTSSRMLAEIETTAAGPVGAVPPRDLSQRPAA